MILENIEVQHKVFGKGTVKSTNGKYMTVAFQTVEKVFVYPDAFEKFLKLADGSVSDEIKNDIEIMKGNRQRIESAKAEENHLAMTRGIVIPGKENTPENPEEDAFHTEPEEI